MAYRKRRDSLAFVTKRARVINDICVIFEGNTMRKSYTLLLLIPSLSAWADNHANHEHQHGYNCGHASEYHVDHFDYNHDGHDHHSHLTDVHEAATSLHDSHAHGHSTSCGHTSRIQNGKVEYQHDGHWHHQHGDHFHESHS